MSQECMNLLLLLLFIFMLKISIILIIFRNLVNVIIANTVDLKVQINCARSLIFCKAAFLILHLTSIFSMYIENM